MSKINYPRYRGIPHVAGIGTIEEAMNPGLSVEEVVLRLKRHHYAMKRLHGIMTSRITAEPIYELKTAFSLHSYLCADHVAEIRKRIGEMREPPLGLDIVPDHNLEIFFDEIQCAPTSEELVFGIYAKAIPLLAEALRKHIRETSILADHPTVRVCRFALMEVEDMEKFGQDAVAGMIDGQWRGKIAHWEEILDEALAAAGGIDGVQTPSGKKAERFYSLQPYVYDPMPKRDERFPDPYNQGVNAEVFLYDPAFTPQEKTLMMFFKRFREIDVPEMMASIITQTPDKPWEYYRDMSRQLWDEARHAMMGEVGFVNLGIDWKKIRFTFNWSMGLNTQLKPLERHGVLYFIEQGLMPKTGKRYEWEIGQESGNPLSRLFQDYDWADEVLHAKIGRDWYVSQFKDAHEAVEYGDKCWSKILIDWKKFKADGLTEHSNWWPGVYKDACKIWGIEPNPKTLAYSETYENKRPDLKTISASA
ncbi:hypothetical protein QQ054_27260 [Oscillatoria amoena NRMC-F 0135]|nr:hypothetical protein [Oscillatoria amoena NRMC-F 0135]